MESLLIFPAFSLEWLGNALREFVLAVRQNEYSRVRKGLFIFRVFFNAILAGVILWFYYSRNSPAMWLCILSSSVYVLSFLAGFFWPILPTKKLRRLFGKVA